MDDGCTMLATVNCEAGGTCNRLIVDRFSDIPDEVAHHILSFLTFGDNREVGCVSKRCLDLYLSFPSLDFDPSYLQKLTMWQRLTMFHYFDRFLTNRGDNKIQRFFICWRYHAVKEASMFNELFRICTWIRYAVRRNVEVFDLQLDTLQQTPIELPLCIFSCQSLRSLELNTCERC